MTKKSIISRKLIILFSFIGTFFLFFLAREGLGETPTQKVVFHTGFEELKGWNCWPKGKEFEIDKNVFREGQSSLKISDKDIVVYTYIQVKENTNYQVNFWYRTKEVTGEIGLNLNFNKKGGGNGSAGYKYIPISSVSNKEWEKFSVEFTTPPETFMCQFGFLSKASGTIWIDELTIYEGTEKKQVSEIEDTKNKTGEISSYGNLIKNSGFEIDDNHDGFPDNWSTWIKDSNASWCIDKEVSHTGKSSLKIQAEVPGRYFVVQRITGLQPGKTYLLKFWVKTENLEGDAAVTCDYGPVAAKPRPYVSLLKMQGSKDWKEFTNYSTVPIGSTWADICLIHTKGTIWFDDIEFKMVDEE